VITYGQARTVVEHALLHARSHDLPPSAARAHPSIRHSHFKNRDGRIFTLSPWPVPTYWRWTTTFRREDYLWGPAYLVGSQLAPTHCVAASHCGRRPILVKPEKLRDPLLLNHLGVIGETACSVAGFAWRPR
jgi:hypothetical protein